MTIWKPRTLWGTLIVAFLPLSVVSIAVVGWMGYETAHRQLKTKIQEEVQRVADRSAESVDRMLRQVEHDVLTLTETPLIEDYVNNRSFGLSQEAEVVRKELERYLEKFLVRTQRYAAVVYVDAKGREVCRIAPRREKGAAFQSAQEMVAGVPYAIVRKNIQPLYEGGESVVIYGCALAGEHQERRGALVLALKVSVLEDLLKDIRVGDSGSASLVISTLASSYIRNPDVLEATAALVAGPWQVRVEAPLQEFMGPIERIRSATVGAIILASLLMLGIVAWLSGVITRPVSALADAAGRVAEGTWEFQAGPAPVEELRKLAVAFEGMVKGLRQRTESLQGKVRELSAMHQLSGAILNQGHRDAILKLALESAIKGLDFERGALYLVESERGVIQGKFTYGVERLSDEQIQQRAIPIGASDILAEVVRRNEPVNIPNAGVDTRVNQQYVQLAETKALCLVPIRTSRGVLGVIGADRQASGRPITDEDVQNLLTFANAMGLAVEKSMLLEEMRGSEELSRSILESSEDAIVALDPNWRVTTWNRGAERLFGFTREERLGVSLEALFPKPEAYRRWMERVNRAAESEPHPRGRDEQDRQSVVELVAKGERPVSVSMTGASLRGDGDQVLGWAAVIRDLTRERQLHQTMVKTEKLSAMGQLVAGIAHELNNPLAVVTGYAQLLHDQVLPPETKNDLERIYLAALRCHKLIQGLLMFSRPTEGEWRAMDLHQSVDAMLTLLGYEIRKRDVTLAVKRARGPLWVNADPVQLEQIVMNLCQNACQAMEGREAADRQLTLRLFAFDRVACLAVQDTGPGVPVGLREKIFEPFFSTKPLGEGTGLGLYLSREIALSHGGNLTYEPVEGGGWAFVLTLPLVDTPQRTEVSLERPVPRTEGRGKLLVVDDDPEVADMLERFFSARGHAVVKAYAIHEADSALKRERFDLVITDLELGGLGSYGFLEDVVSRLGANRVIIVTGNVMSVSAKRFVESLQVAWISKPLELEGLRHEVESRLAPAPEARPRDALGESQTWN